MASTMLDIDKNKRIKSMWMRGVYAV